MPWLFFFSAFRSLPSMRWASCASRTAFHDYGFLALLGRPSLGGRFSGVIHNHPCRIYFVLMGVVHERTALRMIYLDVILYSAGGIVGTMHHVYFSGEPALHMALGAFFSAAEVIPLTFLTLEAWSFFSWARCRSAKIERHHFRTTGR